MHCTRTTRCIYNSSHLYLGVNSYQNAKKQRGKSNNEFLNVLFYWASRFDHHRWHIRLLMERMAKSCCVWMLVLQAFGAILRRRNRRRWTRKTLTIRRSPGTSSSWNLHIDNSRYLVETLNSLTNVLTWFGKFFLWKSFWFSWDYFLLRSLWPFGLGWTFISEDCISL